MARTLQDLTVEGTNAGEVFDDLADSPVARTLRKLSLKDEEFGGIHTGPEAWSRFEALEHLHLELGGCWFADFDLPTLRTLVWVSNGLSDEELEVVTRARWPRLVHLELSTGRDAALSARTLGRLFEGQAFPELIRLGLVNLSFLPLELPRLAQSPLIRRLRVLDLSGGVFAEDDVVQLLDAAEAFRHLAVLDLSRNQLSADACEALRRLCAGQVLLKDQRGSFNEEGEVERSIDEELESEDRYDAITE